MRMKTFRGLLAVIGSLFLLCVTNAQNEESGAGAVILAEVVPPVVFRDGDEGGVEKKMIPGMLLPEGYWVGDRTGWKRFAFVEQRDRGHDYRELEDAGRFFRSGTF